MSETEVKRIIGKVDNYKDREKGYSIVLKPAQQQYSDDETKEVDERWVSLFGKREVEKGDTVVLTGISKKPRDKGGFWWNAKNILVTGKSEPEFEKPEPEQLVTSADNYEQNNLDKKVKKAADLYNRCVEKVTQIYGLEVKDFEDGHIRAVNTLFINLS